MSTAIAHALPVELPDELALQVGRFTEGADTLELMHVLTILDLRAAARRQGRATDVEVHEHSLAVLCGGDA